MTTVLTSPDATATPIVTDPDAPQFWPVTKRVLRVLLGGLISFAVAMAVWWVLVKLIDKPRQTRTPGEVFSYLFTDKGAAANREEMVEGAQDHPPRRGGRLLRRYLRRAPHRLHLHAASQHRAGHDAPGHGAAHGPAGGA